MPKKTYLILSLLLAATGCTKEVYLQAVPCVEGNCAPTEEPEECPELAMQTLTFNVVDVPSPKTNYASQCGEAKRNCRTVCRKVKVK